MYASFRVGSIQTMTGMIIRNITMQTSTVSPPKRKLTIRYKCYRCRLHMECDSESVQRLSAKVWPLQTQTVFNQQSAYRRIMRRRCRRHNRTIVVVHGDDPNWMWAYDLFVLCVTTFTFHNFHLVKFRLHATCCLHLDCVFFCVRAFFESQPTPFCVECVANNIHNQR